MAGEQRVFKFQMTYLKDASFENPGAPHVFVNEGLQEVSVQCNVRERAMADEGFYEVILTVKVESRAGGAPSFLVELQQGGVFEIRGLPEAELNRVLHVACADMLMAFAREAVCDLVVKGGFPQLLIDPVNFQAVYEQGRQALREQGGASKN